MEEVKMVERARAGAGGADAEGARGTAGVEVGHGTNDPVDSNLCYHLSCSLGD